MCVAWRDTTINISTIESLQDLKEIADYITEYNACSINGGSPRTGLGSTSLSTTGMALRLLDVFVIQAVMYT